VYNQPD
jgi:hypothetical protein